MKGNRQVPERPAALRSSLRIYSLREITVSFDGQNQETVVKLPNLSARGMFINTSRTFPEGAVLNLQFALVQTGAEVRTRCEVRDSQAGVGIGVKFIGLPAEAIKMIEREIALSSGGPTPGEREENGKRQSRNGQAAPTREVVEATGAVRLSTFSIRLRCIALRNNSANKRE